MKPERVARIREVLDRRQPDLTIITDRVSKPHNISAIIRSCDAFAVPECHVVWPDEDFQTYRRRAAGSQHWVRVNKHPSTAEGIAHLKERGFRILAAHLSASAQPYDQLDFTQPTAFLMGAELEGVSNEAAELADGHVIVPMQGMVESLNVSVVAALLLSEACRQRRQAGFFDQPRLADADYQRLFFEACYPDLARRCRERKVTYPRLLENGDLEDSAAFSVAYNASSNQ
ncbi:tRNA (guanosine-2'-O-)-methyltransferase [Marinospirillum celere]|uniref:tRNA (guanosine(18)-2'-O)-methyltransferase n=1 Tax=Marinospirillum celere TaxID=1122252 RepID=A0A1I1DYW3_9GAMM|nr:tRNA (guanosine(18)-2'-O)-methyltransferase TrmH [Marinospirillum celere]SFB77920.1 tRNA (guanosine-2'-O-)-methyltransferase [Marinospirillum celere]